MIEDDSACVAVAPPPLIKPMDLPHFLVERNSLERKKLSLKKNQRLKKISLTQKTLKNSNPLFQSMENLKRSM